MAPKKKIGLTRKQEHVRDYILQCVQKEQRTPTIRQIGAKFGLSSTGSTRDIIQALVKKGEIVKDAALSRGIRLNPKRYRTKVTRIRG